MFAFYCVFGFHVQSALMDLFGETVHYVTIHTSKELHIKAGNNNLICQDLFSCNRLHSDGQIVKPVANQIHLHIPIEQNSNQFFELELIRNNETFVIYPHLDAFNRLLDLNLPHQIKSGITADLEKMKNHRNYPGKRRQLTLFSNGHDFVLKNANHDKATHATRIYKRRKLQKREVGPMNDFEFTTNRIVRFLGNLGYGTKQLFLKSKLLLDWSAYLNTMEFIKFYYDKAWAVVWQTFPIMQNKIANFLNDQRKVKINSTIDKLMNIKNPVEEIKKLNETVHAKDMRELFGQHLVKAAVKENSWNETLGDTGDLYEQLLPFYNDLPDMTEVVNLDIVGKLKKHGISGIGSILDNSGDAMLNASSLIIMKSFKYVQIGNRYFERAMDYELKFPFAETMKDVVFQGRFKVSLANIYHLATAIACYHMFYVNYKEVPITKEDVVSFKKAPNAMNIMHVWLKDPASGEPTPWKEYRIRSIIDWFPRLYFGLLMVYITIAFELFGGADSYSESLIPRIFLALNAAMFVPTAFPIDMIEGETNEDRFKQLDKFFVPGFIIGYGWNLMSLFVLVRPFGMLSDKAGLLAGAGHRFGKPGHALELVWENIKAVAFGVPQTYGVYYLIKLMAGRVHWNDYRQSGMWFIQSTAWSLDVTNNWSPLLRPLRTQSFDWLQGITGRYMTFFYTSRSYWEALHGIPVMFFYYQSYFTPATDIVERAKQVKEKIPLPLQQWQDVHDPDNEKLLKEKGYIL
eukprot:NODE_80_length_22759_cov_1.466858.p4 type:complete len:744 gc:universal NODE_80_length_22759_cov_1.466858:3062-831(-)